MIAAIDVPSLRGLLTREPCVKFAVGQKRPSFAMSAATSSALWAAPRWTLLKQEGVTQYDCQQQVREVRTYRSACHRNIYA